jgi:hypothetical protein
MMIIKMRSIIRASDPQHKEDDDHLILKMKQQEKVHRRRRIIISSAQGGPLNPKHKEDIGSMTRRRIIGPQNKENRRFSMQ